MAVPNPDEVATLIVGGRKWDDWTSVMVTHQFADAWAHFRFTAVEREVALQFQPGDECAIYLGGILAIVGVITLRQVSYDASNHQVQLLGKGVTWYASRASILDETGNYDGKSFEEVARKIIAPFGVGVAPPIGKLDATPFKNLQIEPGERLWDCLERLARPRGIVLGSDHLGNFLLIGEHTAQAEDHLTEGDNILSCQVTISIEEAHSDYLVRAQTGGGDDKHGADASQQEAKVSGSLKRYSPILTTAEQPVWTQAEVEARAHNEAKWHEGTNVQATIAVQGWLRDNGDLWRAGSTVNVQSPMAPLHQDLSIQTATFTQESGAGTMTSLNLVAPWLLCGHSDFNVGLAGAPQDPRTFAKEKPAAPATSVPEPPPVKLPS